MSYFQGFVIPVKAENKDAYRAMAAKAAPVFAEYGAVQVVECWEESVPDGKLTDLRRAVQAEPGEKIVYSWIWWPDKATCDAASEKLMADERMQPDGDLPFNPQRMIYAGFEPVHDSGANGGFGYVDAVVGPAPDDRDGFTGSAAKLDAYFMREGAIRTVDGWGVDVPDGKVTDFRRAVAAGDGEQVIFGWIEWPDKVTRDQAFEKIMQEPEVQATQPGFDMKRVIFGGFVPILDTDQH